jgi:hypothetical protein
MGYYKTTHNILLYLLANVNVKSVDEYDDVVQNHKYCGRLEKGRLCKKQPPFEIN